MSGRVFGKDPLGVVPGAGGWAVDGWIGIENAAPVGVERVRALFPRQDFKEIVAEVRIEARERVEECASKLGAGAEKGRAKDDAGDPVGVCLRVGQRQRRAPGA